MAERVLVPVDGSSGSRRALEYALSTHPDAAITALTVIDPLDSVVAAEEGGPVVAEDWYDQSEAAATEILESARETAADVGVDLETETEVGQPARTIVRFADDGGYDHVVIGSHGRTGASRILLGSVAERVLRRASVPVTVVRQGTA